MLSTKELLSQLSGPGDLAVVLLAGTAGLIVDAGLNAVGFLSPGEVGVAAATTALGAKKAYEHSRTRRNADEARQRVIDRATRTRELLYAVGMPEASRSLGVELELVEEGLSDASALEAAVEVALSAYREHRSGGRD